MYATLGPLLEKYDVLICPTNALPAVPPDFDQSNDDGQASTASRCTRRSAG